MRKTPSEALCGKSARFACSRPNAGLNQGSLQTTVESGWSVPCWLDIELDCWWAERQGCSERILDPVLAISAASMGSLMILPPDPVEKSIAAWCACSLSSIFCEQKPGVDLDPLEMNLVAQSASLSIADQQLMLSFPILLDISVRKLMNWKLTGLWREQDQTWQLTVSGEVYCPWQLLIAPPSLSPGLAGQSLSLGVTG